MSRGSLSRGRSTYQLNRKQSLILGTRQHQESWAQELNAPLHHQTPPRVPNRPIPTNKEPPAKHVYAYWAKKKGRGRARRRRATKRPRRIMGAYKELEQPAGAAVFKKTGVRSQTRTAHLKEDARPLVKHRHRGREARPTKKTNYKKRQPYPSGTVARLRTQPPDLNLSEHFLGETFANNAHTREHGHYRTTKNADSSSSPRKEARFNQKNGDTAPKVRCAHQETDRPNPAQA